MARQTISGDYPQVIGSRRLSIINHVGPSSYTAISDATPPTGGDTVQASEFGLKYLEAVIVLGSDNGQYSGVAYNPNLNVGPASSFVLQWNTSHTGAEITGTTNVSARNILLLGIGY